MHNVEFRQWTLIFGLPVPVIRFSFSRFNVEEYLKASSVSDKQKITANLTACLFKILLGGAHMRGVLRRCRER